MFRPCSVVLVVDDPIFRTGLELSLQRVPDLHLAGSCSSFDAAAPYWLARTPLVVVLDYASATANECSAVEQIRRLDVETRMVILADRPTDQHKFIAWQLGATAVVTHESDSQTIVATILRVALGEPAILDMVQGPSRIMQRVLQQVRELDGTYAADGSVDLAVLAPLTDRELDVLRGAASGLGNRDIAARLGISQQTVKNHLNSACRKLGLNDRTQAVLYALRRGWVAPPLVDERGEDRMPVAHRQPRWSAQPNRDA